MRTLKSLQEEHERRPKKPLLGFREWCEYVYDPLKRAKDLRLSEEDRTALIESVEERSSSIPNRLREQYHPR